MHKNRFITKKIESLVIGVYTYKAILRCVVKFLGPSIKVVTNQKREESKIKNTLKIKKIGNVQTLGKGYQKVG